MTLAAALSTFKLQPESFAGQLSRIHAAITSGAALPVNVADARASLELITAIYHSAETGTAVNLPIPSTHPKYANWIPAGRRWR